MAHCITFASSKGGSGKTTICANIGTILSDIGKKCLIIDCDEATHGMTLMYIDQVNSHRKQSTTSSCGVFDYLIASKEYNKKNSDEMYFPEAPKKVDVIQLSERLYFIPATFSFERRPQSQPKEFSTLLRKLVEELQGKFDYILIDAQAGTDTASAAAVGLDVCDEVIIVSEFDPLSTAGIERMKALLPDELTFGRTRILLNKLLPEFVEKFTEFLSVARYLPPLPWTADVVRAYSKRRLALDFNKGNEYTAALLVTVRELLPIEDVEVLDAWLADKAKLVKEPISRQLDVEILSLKTLYWKKQKIKERNSLMKAVFSSSAFVIAGVSVFLLYRLGNIYIAGIDLSDPLYIAVLIGGIGILLNFILVAFGKFEFWTSAGEEAILSSQIRATEKKIEELEFVAKASPSALFGNGRLINRH